MKILVIGNGFDLAHNLPTSYINFLDFCNIVNVIFTDDIEINEFHDIYLNKWDMNSYIKEMLKNNFEKRMCKKIYVENDSYRLEVTTDNEALNELYTHIKDNVWIKYFNKCFENLGENWIDFESEISNVIQLLEGVRSRVDEGGSVLDYEGQDVLMLNAISVAAYKESRRVFRNIRGIDDFIKLLNTELERLTRALEIYISAFVGSITIQAKNPDIERLAPDHILSFNYSDTYERVYDIGKKLQYNYIHGKADFNHNIKNCNLVLGIDEYLNEDEKDVKLECLTFKKYYQRIYKSTDNAYLDWVDEIKDVYTDYTEKKQDVNLRIIESVKDGSLTKYPFESENVLNNSNIEFPQHTLYIFGHSLDVTDKDVLKLLICNDNVNTKIYYYRKNEDDKKVLGNIIRNLVKTIGQDELIRRTGGAHKTIEFISQTII